VTGHTTKLTSTGAGWGTQAYCAPEQAIEFHNATPLVDVYAFGCILHDIYGTPPRVPYQRYSAVDDAIGVVIEKCTEIRSDKRFQSVQSLRAALLSALSEPTDVTLSIGTANWVEGVEDVGNWDRARAEKFVRFVFTLDNDKERSAIFRAVTEETFEAINKLDGDFFKTVANKYCEWIEEREFDFDYCDVLIQRVETIFRLGDAETKANAALAAARLGRSHNRWFVMGRLVRMCGNSLDDAVARRIAIEVKARAAEEDFIRCAAVIRHEVQDYHPKIAAALKQPG